MPPLFLLAVEISTHNGIYVISALTKNKKHAIGWKSLQLVIITHNHFAGVVTSIFFPYLHNAYSVRELKLKEREEGEETFCVFHVEHTVMATVFLFSLGIV